MPLKIIKDRNKYSRLKVLFFAEFGINQILKIGFKHRDFQMTSRFTLKKICPKVKFEVNQRVKLFTGLVFGLLSIIY
jgi:hypothetical protein